MEAMPMHVILAWFINYRNLKKQPVPTDLGQCWVCPGLASVRSYTEGRLRRLWDHRRRVRAS